MASKSTMFRGATTKLLCFGQEQKRNKYSLWHRGQTPWAEGAASADRAGGEASHARHSERPPGGAPH